MEVAMLWSRKCFQRLVSSVTSLSIGLFIQISIRLPWNTESICSPVSKLMGNFGESEIPLGTSSFIFSSFILTFKKAVIFISDSPGDCPPNPPGLIQNQIFMTLVTSSSTRCFLRQMSVSTRRWHLLQMAQPSDSTQQRANSTSPINCTSPQGVHGQTHCPSFVFWAIHQAAPPTSSEHDFLEQLQGRELQMWETELWCWMSAEMRMAMHPSDFCMELQWNFQTLTLNSQQHIIGI